MANLKNRKYNDYKIEFEATDEHKWSREKVAHLKFIAKQVAQQRSPERKLKNEMLSIQYQMEEYLDKKLKADSLILTLEIFLKLYLEVLGLTLKKFSTYIDTTDGNLKKYLSGERKFNIDLAMKFGHFFHTSPDLWLNIQAKNDLLLLMREKEAAKKYEKYDYKRFAQTATH